MLRIEIVSAEFELIEGVSKKTGNPYSFRKQKGYLHQPGQKYPEGFDFTLEDDQPPYQAGNYTLAPNAVSVNRDGRLDVKPVLVPMQAAKAA